MARLLVHLLVSALLLLLVSHIVSGIHIASFGYALLAALVLGIANFLVRPILMILTLGLFLIVINALMLMLTGAIVPGFHVAGFVPALLGGLLLGLFNLAASALLNRSARRPALR